MNKHYGIWGLGIVGKSVAKYLSLQGRTVTVMDRRPPTEEEKAFLEQYTISYVSQDYMDSFFKSHDHLMVSPGIDRKPVEPYKEKIIEELDLFYQAWHKKIIGVTGTLGKTSLVHLLSQMIGSRGIAGGNIGRPMLDLINQDVEYAILELSSYQLEHSTFSPDLAIWTNLYPNHLDRHGTMDNYFMAKFQLINHQKDGNTLLPYNLAPKLRALVDRPLTYFSLDPVLDQLEGEIVYTMKDNHLYRNGDMLGRCHHSNLHPENNLILHAAADILDMGVPKNLTLPSHRLELVGYYNGAVVYNDSKSTVPEATLAALEQLQSDRVHLIVGGMSKGTERASFIATIEVASLYCFGAEAHELAKSSKSNVQVFDTLEELMVHINPKQGDTILFSPAGTSFDLYRNYEERGNHFKKLVDELWGS